MAETLIQLLNRVRACQVCEPALPLGAHPVLQMDARARILIAGQAPGLKVHQSGIPFDDASGERLRDWLGISRDVFYDPAQVAIVPMGFCYPGRRGNGDAPPRPECAPLWRAPLLAQLTALRLTLVIGRYAQAWHVGDAATLTDAVSRWRSEAPARFVLPHPSPRNRPWLAAHPWFEAALLPALRDAVRHALA